MPEVQLQVGFGLQILRWRSGCRFIRECSYDYHLSNRKEGQRTGKQRKKLHCDMVSVEDLAISKMSSEDEIIF